jgi:pSer/pThr/pTyr-binding forkhead associated (FHA) protein
MTEVVGGTAASAGLTLIRPGRERTPPQVRLAIVRDGQPSEFVSRDCSITFGRAQDKVSVSIQDPLVSSEHARIRREAAQFFLEDLNSKNGTQLNGEPIAPGTPRLLKNNDRIYIGDTVVTFAVDSR